VQFFALLLVAAFAGITVHHLLRGGSDGAGARRSTCDGVEEGWIEIRGRVAVQRELRAPLSGRRAAGYWLVIEQERGPTAWEPVVVLSELAAFDVRDDTGRVAVRARPEVVHADIFEQRGRGGPFKPLPARVERLLHEHHRSTQGVLFGKAFRWREQVLEPGHDVTVRGWARRRPAEDVSPAGAAPSRPAVSSAGPYRHQPSQWVLEASPQRPMQVIDRGEGARRPFGWRRLAPS